MNSINIYTLLKYYNENKDQIIFSLNVRNLQNNIEKIDALIQKLKDLNNEFNSVTRERNANTKKQDKNSEFSKSIRQSKSLLGKQISEIENELKKQLLILPNIVTQKALKKDQIIFESQKYNNLFGIKFTDYIEKYCFTHYLKTLFLNFELSSFKNYLIQYFIRKTIESGFNFISVPYIACREDFEHAGQLPKFENSLYKINEKKNYENEIFLIPTAEITICRYLNFIDLNILPVLLSAYTPCFRNENATSSRVNKPFIRQGHFDKVETFIVCDKSCEQKYLDFCLQRNIEILKTLGFIYRIINIGGEEMSTTAKIQYDIEVYMPRSNMWLEVASCSSCGNYQLYKNPKFKNYKNIISINCSSFPIERIICLLIEYYYHKDLKVFETLKLFLDNN